MAAPRCGPSLAASCGLLTAALLLSPARAATAPPGDLFDEIYRQGQAFERSLKTITARFTETSTSRLLKQPLVASGMLAVERPSKIALHYREPEARTILIDGGTMRMEWPSRGLSQRKDVGAAMGRIQKYFVGASPKELRSHFEIAAEVDAENPQHWLVRMTPTRRQIRDAITRIDLRVAQATSMLTWMQITFPNGDTKTMTFEDVVRNRGAAGCFEVRLEVLRGASGCL